MKICTKCKEDKVIDDFSFDKRSCDGRQSSCKSCGNLQAREYRKNNKQLVNSTVKAYRAKNREITRAYAKKHYQANNEFLKQKSRDWRANNKGVHNFYNATYRTRKLQRTPSWLTEDDYSIMRAYYRVAQKLTEVTGETYHVDHIIPLQGELISGLHCPRNLQVLKGSDNNSKGNRFDIEAYNKEVSYG